MPLAIYCNTPAADASRRCTSAEGCHTMKPHSLHYLDLGTGLLNRRTLQPLALQVTFLESLVTRLSHERAPPRSWLGAAALQRCSPPVPPGRQ